MPTQSIDLSATTTLANFNGSPVEQINLNGTGIWTQPVSGWSPAGSGPIKMLQVRASDMTALENGTVTSTPIVISSNWTDLADGWLMYLTNSMYVGNFNGKSIVCAKVLKSVVSAFPALFAGKDQVENMYGYMSGALGVGHYNQVLTNVSTFGFNFYPVAELLPTGITPIAGWPSYYWQCQFVGAGGYGVQNFNQVYVNISTNFCTVDGVANGVSLDGSETEPNCALIEPSSIDLSNYWWQRAIYRRGVNNYWGNRNPNPASMYLLNDTMTAQGIPYAKFIY